MPAGRDSTALLYHGQRDLDPFFTKIEHNNRQVHELVDPTGPSLSWTAPVIARSNLQNQFQFGYLTFFLNIGWKSRHSSAHSFISHDKYIYSQVESVFLIADRVRSSVELPLHRLDPRSWTMVRSNLDISWFSRQNTNFSYYSVDIITWYVGSEHAEPPWLEI